MSAWKSWVRPSMIFIPFGAGFCFPAAHDLHGLIRWFIIGMFYMVCLQLRWRQLKPQKSHFMLVLVNLCMGVVPYFILHISGYETLALTAFFVGIMPTATAAPVVMGFLKGRVGYVVTAFVLTNLTISFSLVFLLPVVVQNQSAAFINEVGTALLWVVGLPIILAVVTRIFFKNADMWPRKCQTLTFSAWSCCLFICAADAAWFFKNNPDTPQTVILEVGFIALIICILNFFIGYKIGRKRLHRESSQALGQKNTMFAMYLALTFISPLVAMGPIFYVLWHNTWNAIQMYLYDRHKDKRIRHRSGNTILKI